MKKTRRVDPVHNIKKYLRSLDEEKREARKEWYTKNPDGKDTEFRRQVVIPSDKIMYNRWDKARKEGGDEDENDNDKDYEDIKSIKTVNDLKRLFSSTKRRRKSRKSRKRSRKSRKSRKRKSRKS